VSLGCGFRHLMGCFRGASAVAECQGMFKMQHDLDKVGFCITGITSILPYLTSASKCTIAAHPLHYAARDARPRAGPEVHPRFPAHLPPAPSNRRRVVRRRGGACRSVSFASSVCRVAQSLVSETCDSAPDGDAVMDPIALCTACEREGVSRLNYRGSVLVLFRLCFRLVCLNAPKLCRLPPLLASHHTTAHAL
jgi:hypothetical protein